MVEVFVVVGYWLQRNGGGSVGNSLCKGGSYSSCRGAMLVVVMVVVVVMFLVQVVVLFAVMVLEVVVVGYWWWPSGVESGGDSFYRVIV